MGIDATTEAIYLNACLMGYADGRLDAAEKDLLGRLRRELHLSDAEGDSLQVQLRQGDLRFRPVDDARARPLMIAMATGLAAADGNLDPRERRALFDLAKAIGVEASELRQIFRATWGRDPFDVALGPVTDVAINQPLVLTDHFDRVAEFAISAAPVRLTRVTLAELERRRVEAPCAIFHAAPQRQASLDLFERLRASVHTPTFVLVAHRHEAAQLSHVKEAGAQRCLIEPVYPRELADLLISIGLLPAPA